MSDGGNLIATGAIIGRGRGRDQSGEDCISAVMTLPVTVWEAITGGYADFDWASGRTSVPSLEERIKFYLTVAVGECLYHADVDDDLHD